MNKSLRALVCIGLLGSVCWTHTAALAQNTRAASGTTIDRVLALVNSEPITANDLRYQLQRLANTDEAKQTPAAAWAEFVLERMITERALLLHAKNLGLAVDDSRTEQAIADIAQQNQISVVELQSQVQKMGISLSRFRQSVRDDLTLRQLREQVVGSTPVSEQDIDRFLDEQNRIGEPSQTLLQLSQLLIPLPDAPSAAQIAQAEATVQGLKAQLKAGTAFEALVKQYAAGTANVVGSHLPARTADRMPPLFVAAVKTAQRGEVVGPLRSGAGLHLLQLVQKRNLNLPAEEVTETHARHILLRPSATLSQDQAVAQLAAWRADIMTGKTSFAALARAHSQDGSAPNGGDLGWASPGMFVPEFEQPMNALAPQQISQPVVSRFGVHLLEVLERRNTLLTRAQYRDQIRNLLRQQKGEEAFEQLTQDVRGQSFVEKREAL